MVKRKNVGLSGNEQRHFVVGKDINKNILYVAFDEDNEYLFSDSCLIENANFISDDRPTFCTAKFRYRGLDHPVELQYLSNNQILVKYQGLAKSVTPGQALSYI